VVAMRGADEEFLTAAEVATSLELNEQKNGRSGRCRQSRVGRRFHVGGSAFGRFVEQGTPTRTQRTTPRRRRRAATASLEHIPIEPSALK
jgi:hypothetical protein